MMKILIISFPILVYVLVRWFVYKLIKKKYLLKTERKEFIKSNQINSKLADLLKPLSIASLLLTSLFYEEDNKLEDFMLLLDNVLFSLRIVFLFVCIGYSYYVLLDLKDCLRSK